VDVVVNIFHLRHLNGSLHLLDHGHMLM
jgi:hypothetical protein